jgi:uncharacterized protein YjdB
MKKAKILHVSFIILLLFSIAMISPRSIANAKDNDIDYTFEQTSDEDKDAWDYKRIVKRSVDSIKKDYDFFSYQEDDDRNIYHYSDHTDIVMTTIKTKEMKISKDSTLDLNEGYILTSQVKYAMDLSDATWSVITNKEYISVDNGICSVIKYPQKETTAIVRAVTMKCIDDIWRKVVIYFYVIPAKNTAIMDKIRTVPINSKSKLSISLNTASDKTIKWETNKPKVATVSNDGVVKGISKGKCTITATLADNYQVKCNIIVPSTTESLILGNAEGSYAGTDSFAEPQIYYDIAITKSSIAGNPYEVIQLDRKSIPGMDIFYVKLYDRYSGNLIQEKTFAIDSGSLFWFNTPDTSWDYVILY